MALKMVRLFIAIQVLMAALTVSAQRDSCWTVLVLKRGKVLEPKPDMAALSSTGFYLYKNCIYTIDLKDSRQIAGRLVGVKPDTLLFTNFFNRNVALAARSTLDTLRLHYRQLDKLRLIGDRSLGLYVTYDLDHYDFLFRKDTTDRYFPSEWAVIFNNDPSPYELVPNLTAQGIGVLFEESGRTYYFYGGGMTKPDRSAMDESYDRRYAFWFTPCRVEEINGIALGFHPKNVKNERFNERDSLVIRGIDLEINPFAVFSLLHPRLTGPYPDSIQIYDQYIRKDWQVKVQGLHVSAITTVNEMQIHGVNLTGALTVADQLNGVSISGLTSFFYRMNGVSVAAIYNRATVVKGLQIGLINRAREMRGVQIGLWNVNGRRSLPLLNWQFRSARKR